MSKAGKRLIESANQALGFAEGTADAGEYRVHIPDEIDVKHIREALDMSQSEFAEHFGFSVRTLQDWEQGRRVPNGVSRNFLILLQRAPDMVRETLLAADGPQNMPKPEATQDLHPNGSGYTLARLSWIALNMLRK